MARLTRPARPDDPISRLVEVGFVLLGALVLGGLLFAVAAAHSLLTLPGVAS